MGKLPTHMYGKERTLFLFFLRLVDLKDKTGEVIRRCAPVRTEDADEKVADLNWYNRGKGEKKNGKIGKS